MNDRETFSVNIWKYWKKVFILWEVVKIGYGKKRRKFKTHEKEAENMNIGDNSRFQAIRTIKESFSFANAQKTTTAPI